jgi:opacity protein-like surface antigen
MKKLFVLAVALIVGVAFALPAAAQDKAEWSWYGQTRMWTAWEMADEETLFGGSGGSRARGWNPGAGLPLQDDDELEWKLQTNARLGANVKWGNVGGRVEFGNTGEPRGGDFGTTLEVDVRYLEFRSGHPRYRQGLHALLLPGQRLVRTGRR